MKKMKVMSITAFLITGVVASVAGGLLLNHTTNQAPSIIKKQVTSQTKSSETTLKTIIEVKNDSHATNINNEVFKNFWTTDENNKIINQGTVYNYLELTNPVPDTNYYIVPDTMIYNGGNGKFEFYLWADKYYDEVGSIIVGDESSKIRLVFFNEHLISNVEVLPNYPKDIAVNKWRASLGINSDYKDLVTETWNLEKYFSFQNFPDGAQFRIRDLDYAPFQDFVCNQVLFNLISTYSNPDNQPGIVQMGKNWGRYTLTLGDWNAPTSIELITNYPKDFTPPLFMENFKKDGAFYDGVNIWTTKSLGFLSNYFNFNSFVPSTHLKLTLISSNDNTGELILKLKPNKTYDKDGNIIDNTTSYQFDLKLASLDDIPPPTNIIAKTGDDLPTIGSQEEFENLILVDGEYDKTILANFFNGLETIPTTVEIVEVKWKSTVDELMTFEIKLSGYYDGSTTIIHKGEKTFEFSIGIKTPDIAPQGNKVAAFPWWWIVTGVGGLLLLIVVGIVFFKIIPTPGWAYAFDNFKYSFANMMRNFRLSLPSRNYRRRSSKTPHHFKRRIRY